MHFLILFKYQKYLICWVTTLTNQLFQLFASVTAWKEGEHSNVGFLNFLFILAIIHTRINVTIETEEIYTNIFLRFN